MTSDYDRASGKVVINGAVVADQEPTTQQQAPGIDTQPLYRSVADVPSPGAKEVKADINARELAEGFVGPNGINRGMAAGPNPHAHRPSPHNPNARADPKNRWRFIPGTGYYDLQQQPLEKRDK
jgi:hypothetical protein